MLRSRIGETADIVFSDPTPAHPQGTHTTTPPIDPGTVALAGGAIGAFVGYFVWGPLGLLLAVPAYALGQVVAPKPITTDNKTGEMIPLTSSVNNLAPTGPISLVGDASLLVVQKLSGGQEGCDAIPWPQVYKEDFLGGYYAHTDMYGWAFLGFGPESDYIFHNECDWKGI
jgi:hypothetical protein